MTPSRFLLAGLLKLALAAACLVGAIAAFRLLVNPLLVSAFKLGPGAAVILRRLDIFAAVVFSYWAFVHFFERRAVSELAPRVGWTLIAGLAGALSIGVTIAVLYATGQYQLVSFAGFGRAGDVLATLGIAAVLEEVAFRAILFRLLEERIGSAAAVVISALVFAGLHMGNHGANAVTMILGTLAGIMWAGVFMLSRNIWVAAAHHCCWNSTIFLIGLPLSGEESWRASAALQTTVHGSDFWTGGAFGPEDSPVTIVVCIAICLALWRLAQRNRQVRPAGRPAPLTAATA